MSHFERDGKQMTDEECEDLLYSLLPEVYALLVKYAEAKGIHPWMLSQLILNLFGPMTMVLAVPGKEEEVLDQIIELYGEMSEFIAASKKQNTPVEMLEHAQNTLTPGYRPDDPFTDFKKRTLH